MFQNSRTLDILRERFQCTPIVPTLKFWVFSHHFGALKRPLGFAPRTLRLKLVFRPFHRRTRPVAKTSIVARKQQMVLEAETTRNMSFGPTVVDWACSLQKNKKQF